MEFNVLGLILKLKLMSKIFIDTPSPKKKKTGVWLVTTKNDQRLVITGLGPQKTGFNWFSLVFWCLRYLFNQLWSRSCEKMSKNGTRLDF